MNSIHTQLEKDEMMEAQARYLEQKGFRELFDLGCGAEWGDEDCGRCDCRPYVQASMQHTDFISNIC